MSEAEIAKLKVFAPGMTAACIDKARFGGFEAVSNLAVEKCYEMAPARKWRGRWRNDFEGSRFCPQPMEDCGYDAPGDEIWLSYSEGFQRPRSWPQEGNDGVYEVEFVGRLTAKRGHYGGWGTSQHELVVDRVVSIRTLVEPQFNHIYKEP